MDVITCLDKVDIHMKSDLFQRVEYPGPKLTQNTEDSR